MLHKILMLATLGLTLNLFSQKISVQFYQGIAKPMVSFESNADNLSYKTNLTTDTRLGVSVGNLDKISLSFLLGATTVSAFYTSDAIISSFTHSSLLIELPIRLAIKKSVIKSFAIGSSMGVLLSSSQTTNGLPVKSESIFEPTNFSLLTEVSFSGYSHNNLNINPFLSHRMMLNSADKDGDKLKLNSLSFGLKIVMVQ